MRYFESTVGDVGPASTVERRRAFISEDSAMTRLLLRLGVRLVRCPGHADYYSDRPGGNEAGRSMEPPPYDGRALWPWTAKVQPGMAAGIGLVVRIFNRSVRSFLIAARVQARTILAKVTGRKLLTNGTALVAQLVKAGVDRGVPMWTGAAFAGFVVEDGWVTGGEVVKDGKRLLVAARRGVVVAAGGFAHSEALRERYGGEQGHGGVVLRQPRRHRRRDRGRRRARRRHRPPRRGVAAAWPVAPVRRQHHAVRVLAVGEAVTYPGFTGRFLGARDLVQAVVFAYDADLARPHRHSDRALGEPFAFLVGSRGLNAVTERSLAAENHIPAP
ncbi:FAD-binding protein [Streptomyces sp. NPDC048106]|uniref:FAD-binding protein n=1 Tax=Streptomyces sp. NPDC048106 TaxID=3155750 RepID=UPI003452E6C0